MGGGWAVVLAAAAAGLLAVLLAQAPAEAHDHRIPEAVLKKGAKELQVGRRVIESSWVSALDDGTCQNATAFYAFELPDGSFNYPEVDRVAAGADLRVRVSKAQRPDSLRILAYPAVDEHGNPEGRGRVLKRTLERGASGGKTAAWDARFSLDRAGRDYYLIVEGHWRDEEGCGADQYAHWSFHVKTRA